MFELKVLVTAVFAILIIIAAFTGKVKINDEPLPWPVGLLVGGPIVLLIGTALIAAGVVFTSPVWIWFLK